MGLLELFKPAWQSKDKDKSNIAVAKITNPQKLAKIAKKAPCWTARIAAIRKLDEKQYQELFVDIVQNDEISDVRLTAVCRLTNQDVLLNVAKNDKNDNVRRAAVLGLTDMSILLSFAKNRDESEDISRAAAEKITDRDALIDIAKNGHWHASDFARGKLCEDMDAITDPDMLMFLLEYMIDRCRHHRHMQDLAIKNIDKINDQYMLAELICSTIQYYADIRSYGNVASVLLDVIKKISDEKLLFKIATQAHEYFGVCAVQKMTDTDSLNKLTAYVRTHTFSYERESFGAVTTEQGSEEYRDVSNAAVKRLSEIS